MLGLALFTLFGAVAGAVLSDAIAHVDQRANKYLLWHVLLAAVVSAVFYLGMSYIGISASNVNW